MLAHRVADSVMRRDRIPGAFATRLLYVSVTRNPEGKDFYRLTLADSDGRRPIVLLEGRDPILAPAWSLTAWRWRTYVRNLPPHHLSPESADR